MSSQDLSRRVDASFVRWYERAVGPFKGRRLAATRVLLRWCGVEKAGLVTVGQARELMRKSGEFFREVEREEGGDLL